ncbi:MAG TPA: hypothetical protein VK769_07110, partial [Verrucomicrobiae bacterium]|nr:hypothetical protein [Verrucomicrobiae bacterium]
MKKRLLIILSVGLVIGGLGIGTWRIILAQSIATYKGKTAPQWLMELHGTNQMKAFEAFREMGPKALPVIVSALEKKDSAWDRFYQRN